MLRRQLFSLILLLPAGLYADSVAGLSWKPPAHWKAQGPAPMRAATYAVPAVAGDPEPGECVVYYFGPGDGGTAAANVKRWIGQFEQPDGSSSEKAARTAKKQVGSLKVTTIDLKGTYLSGAPMAPKTRKPNFRMLGAIVEGPNGPWFFKFTGPLKTVAAAEKAFTAMIDSIKR